MSNVLPLKRGLNDFELHEIQISGIEIFQADKWKEAILYYLDGVWGDEEYVMYRPKISLGGLSLRRGTHYYIRGTAPDEVSPDFLDTEKIYVTSSLEEVDQGLIRLVKNEKIKMLVITFGDNNTLSLWKKEDGQYGCRATGFHPEPYTLG